MKRPHITIRFADVAILAAVVMLNPLNPLFRTPPPPRIPDKVEIRYPQATASDSTKAEGLAAEMDEIGYYLRVHNVTDDGYDLLASWHFDEGSGNVIADHGATADYALTASGDLTWKDAEMPF